MQQPKPLYLVLGLVAPLILALVLFLRVIATSQSVSQVDQEWQASAGFDPLKAYPPRDANGAALRIEALVAPLGIEIAPKDAEDRARPSEEAAEALKTVDELTREHLRELRSPSPIVTAPPEPVMAWLIEASSVLEELAVLLEAEAPRWDLHLEEGFRYQLPNFLGHLQLHRGLILKGSESARLGAGEEEVAKWLTAARALQVSIEEDPALIQRLINMAEHRELLALLRALNPPPSGWGDLVNPRPWRALAHESLRLEGWSLLQSYRSGAFEEDIAYERHPAWLIRFLAGAGVVQHAKSMEHGVQRLEREDPRQFDKEQFFDEEYGRIPRWNIIARLLFPNFFDVSIKGAKHELDNDLTARVLELRALIVACETEAITVQSVAPSPIPEINWIYETGDVGLVVRASDALPVGSKFPLPLEFHLTVPPACVAGIELGIVD